MVGAVLGIIFGASSLYLVLKVGLTVSASIPVAVISITLFRLLSKFGVRDATILENNIVQTAGSAGESIAFGVGVTMPAILILGFDLELTRVMLVAVLGGLLGILMMIPLRRALIVKQHGTLKYPEGTACAEVLKAGASKNRAAPPTRGERRRAGAASAPRTIFSGFGIGLALQGRRCRRSRAGRTRPSKVFGAPLKGGSVAAEISPELLGVGYIIGPRIAAHHGRRRRAGVPGADPADQVLRRRGSPSPLAPGTMPIARHGARTRSAAPTSCTSAPARSRPAASSACVRALPTIWHGIRGGLARPARQRAAAPAAPAAHRARPAAASWSASACWRCSPCIMLAPVAAHEPARRAADRACSASCS